MIAMTQRRISYDNVGLR